MAACEENEEMTTPIDMLDRIHKVDSKANTNAAKQEAIEKQQSKMWEVIDAFGVKVDDLKMSITKIVAIATAFQIIGVPIIIAVSIHFIKKGL